MASRSDEQARFGYHPEPGARLDAGVRRVSSRRQAIESRVDLKGKSMIDFGCSGGYFGFAWADTLSAYLGIDGDAQLIARNQRFADERRLTSLRFQHGVITPEFVRAQEPADVGLFLSVFHHILAASKAYDWNGPTAFDPVEILHAMAERLDVLVFEMGYPDEGFDWCADLPPMSPSPRAWARNALREAGFRYIELLSPDEIYGPSRRARRLAASGVGLRRDRSALLSRLAQRLIRHDPRDDRDIFVARR